MGHFVQKVGRTVSVSEESVVTSNMMAFQHSENDVSHANRQNTAARMANVLEEGQIPRRINIVRNIELAN